MRQTLITQNDFLNGLRRARTRFAVYLVGGAILPAVLLKSFDQHTLMLSDRRTILLVQKSSILTVVPETKPQIKPTKAPVTPIGEDRLPSASAFGKTPRTVAIAVKRKPRVADPVL